MPLELTLSKMLDSADDQVDLLELRYTAKYIVLCNHKISEFLVLQTAPNSWCDVLKRVLAYC